MTVDPCTGPPHEDDVKRALGDLAARLASGWRLRLNLQFGRIRVWTIRLGDASERLHGLDHEAASRLLRAKLIVEIGSYEPNNPYAHSWKEYRWHEVGR